MKTQPNRRNGFTLVELLISIVILGVGLTAVAQLFITGSYAFQKAQNMSIATQRAQRELERIQNYKYTNLNISFTNGTMVPDQYPLVTQQSPFDGYTQTVQKQGATVESVTLAFNMANELPGSHLDDNGQPMNTITFTRLYPSLLRAKISIHWKGAPRAQSAVDVVTLITQKW